MSALVLKRGRGRPRLNESREYNDSDMQLISEFKRRPALFDRNHPMYRDRENTDRLWQEMGELLNTPVPQIKERTMQLRNRYNIERRRIDAVSEQEGAIVKSPWSLFEHLEFLSIHIKTRRPLIPSRTASPIPARPAKRTKVQSNVTETSTDEQEDEDDNDHDRGRDHENDQDESNSFQTPAFANNYNYYVDRSESDHIPNGGRLNYVNYAEQFINNNTITENENRRGIYNSFGQFVSSSLIGMKEKDALRLLEKFTKEIVNAMQTPIQQCQMNGGDPC